MKSLKYFAILISTAGLLAMLWAIASPADSQNLVLFSFSRTKLMLMAGLAALWLGFTAFAWTWRSRDRAARLLDWLDKSCLGQNKLASLVILLLLIPLVLLVTVFTINSIPLESKVYEAWAPVTWPVVFAMAHRFLPLWVWLALTSFAAAVFLGFRYWQALLQPKTWAWEYVGQTLIILMITLATMFHWAVLGFQLRFFVNNPAWYWKIDPLPFSIRDFYFVLGALALFIVIIWALAVKKNFLASLIVILFLGWYLQIGIGYLMGAGFSSLHERYFNTYHKIYPFLASQNNASLLDDIRNYENRYARTLFTNTKPPGLMAFYITLEKLVNGSQPGMNNDQRYERLSWIITYSFPVLAVLIVFLIYFFTRKLLGISPGSVAVLSAFLYVLSPNIILFSLFADQAIYPTLFLAGISLSIFVIRKASFLLAFLLGAFLYLAVFFAFTMLPLYVFTGIYLVLHSWFSRHERTWQEALKIGLGIALGTALLFLVFLVFLNYNFFPRFQAAVQVNHNFDFYLRVGQRIPPGAESFITRLQQIAGAAWLNNLDFAAALGFPIYILALIQGWMILVRSLKGNSSAGGIVLASGFSSFIILNLAGTAQGEVPRLWMFWVPFFVILAVMELKEIFHEKAYLAVSFLAVTQLITLLLTYHFQDLRM